MSRLFSGIKERITGNPLETLGALFVAILMTGCAMSKAYRPTDLTLGIDPSCSSVEVYHGLDVKIAATLKRYGVFKALGQATHSMDKSFDLIVVCPEDNGTTSLNVKSAYYGTDFFNEAIATVVFGKWFGHFMRFNEAHIFSTIAQTFSEGSPAHRMVMAERESFRKGTDNGPMPAKPPAIHSQVHSDMDKPEYSIPDDPNRYAIVVGIEKYPNLPDAAFAERDAETVREHLLAMGYPSRNVVLLTGTAASRAGLAKNLETWLPNNVKENGSVFFYYAGYGAPDPTNDETYIVPSDGDPQYLADTAYPLKRLYEKLSALKARQIVVVLDSCFSGSGGRSVLAKGTRPLVMKVDTATVPQDLTIFAAASGSQITGTLEDQGHGTFTYFFLKGLSGAAKDSSGAVTANSLYTYLKPKVQDAAKRQNRDQEPILHTQGDQELVRF